MREYEKGGSRGSRRGSLKAGSGSGRFSRKTDRRTAPSWRGFTGSPGGRDPARGRREKPMAGSALLSLFPWNCEKGSTFPAACDRIILISSIGGFPAKGRRKKAGRDGQTDGKWLPAIHEQKGELAGRTGLPGGGPLFLCVRHLCFRSSPGIPAGDGVGRLHLFPQALVRSD